MDKPQMEICTIRIMFPIESDEQAIDCKKKIVEVLSDVPNIQTQFMIMSNPASVPPVR